MQARRLGELDADLAWKSIFRDELWMSKIGVGGVLSASALLLLMITPLFAPVAFALIALLYGYLLRVIRYKVMNPDSKLPEWDNWLDLLMAGLTWLAVQFGYWLIVISVATVMLLSAAAQGRLHFSHPEFVAWALTGGGAVAAWWFMVSVWTTYLMVNFAVKENVRAGFALWTVFERMRRNGPVMLVAWILGNGVVLASIIVPSLTLIGIFLVPSALFFGLVICASLHAQAWGSEFLPEEF